MDAQEIADRMDQAGYMNEGGVSYWKRPLPNGQCIEVYREVDAIAGWAARVLDLKEQEMAVDQGLTLEGAIKVAAMWAVAVPMPPAEADTSA